MSTLSDPDYTLQLIRLQCLRRHADPVLPSIITFPETFSPHVLSSDLIDPSVWPELSIVRPPEPVAAVRSNGKSSTGLNYSQTIVGNKAGGGAGMRVAGINKARPEWLKKKSRSMSMKSEQSDAPSVESPTVSTHTLENADLEKQLPLVRVQSPISPEPSASSNQTKPERKSRPITYLHDSASIQDKEISDAIRWQSDGPEFNDESGSKDPNPRSPSDDRDGNSIPLSPAEDDEHAPASQSSNQPVETPLAGHFPADSELPSPSDEFVGKSVSYDVGTEPQTIDEFDFVPSTTSVLEASSYAARQSRSRLRQKKSELDLARIGEQDGAQEITAGNRPVASTSSSKDESTQIEEQVTAPTEPLKIGRRERRRVNISGKFHLPLQQLQAQANGLTPIKEPDDSELQRFPSPETSTKLSLADVPGRLRHRAETDPKISQLHQSRSLQRQASESALNARSRASSLSVQQHMPTSSSTNSLQNQLRPTRPVSPLLSFPIRPMEIKISPKPPVSALTTMLQQKPAEEFSENPFTTNYAALIVKGAGSVFLELKIFFPSSKAPTKPITIKIKKDASVEEVIGVSLWFYYEEKRQPFLLSEYEKDNWNGEDWRGKCNPAAWNLRIVEDEVTGDVDDDFPALDRPRAVSAFSFSAFAVVEATPNQFKQNEALQNTISRRPSRVITRRPQLPKDPSLTNLTANHLLPSTSARNRSGSEIDPDQQSNSMFLDTPIKGMQAPGSFMANGGEEVYLRIRVPILGLQAVVTTLKVTTQTYLADVLETIIKKRKEHLQDAKDWVLMLGDRDIVAPLDRTVQSLQGSHNLRLVKKSQVSDLLRKDRTAPGRIANTNPSASIFKRLSEPPQPKYVTASDVTAQIKRWTVFRKHAMSLGRHERVLTIDGDYLTISHPPRTASTARAVSYHMKDVVDCKQSRRMIGSFKLLVYVNRELKRYDFEAENISATTEIINAIGLAKKAWKASEMGRQPD